MKRLQRYYYLVGVPLLLLAVGTVVFFDEIASTVRGNPHPQINYIIFFLIAAGGLHMLQHVHRINREGRLLQDFMEKIKVQGSSDAMRRWLSQTGRHDVSEVLELVLDIHGKPVGGVQHAALESELTHFKTQLQRRLLLAQFLSGLMVGMGLLGTFIGLLGALSEIGKLIGSFAMDSQISDPVAAVSELVARLTEPMKAMGVAFSASLFGVLGSLIMGMLGVFIKSATGELGSIVQSRMVWLTDLAGSGPDVQPMQEALSELAEHSPLLKGLTVALDQSERRVRQLLQSMDQLLAQMQASAQTQQATLQHQQGQRQDPHEKFEVVVRTQELLRQTLAAVERGEQRQAEVTALLTQQHQHLQLALAQPDHTHETVVQMLQAQEQASRSQMVHWQDALKFHIEQMQQERAQWLGQLQARAQSQQDARQVSVTLIERIERSQLQSLALGQQLLERLGQEHADTKASQQRTAELLQHTLAELREDSQQRLKLAGQTQRWMEEQQARQEQLVQLLLGQRRDNRTPESTIV